MASQPRLREYANREKLLLDCEPKHQQDLLRQLPRLFRSVHHDYPFTLTTLITDYMKHAINAFLVLALIGSFVWAAIAPGMQALIPTFTAICAGVALVSRKTDYIKYF